MFQLYELNEEKFTPYDTASQHKKIEVVPIKDKLCCGTLKERIWTIYWFLLTSGKAKIYLIRDEKGEVIHSSYVIPKCMKFPFMGEQDIEIGPCATRPDYRGVGLYPYVLAEIIKNESQKHGKVFMIVDDKNVASIRGIEKVSFFVVAQIKKDWMKRYVIAE